MYQTFTGFNPTTLFEVGNVRVSITILRTFVLQEDEATPDVFGGLKAPEDGVNIHGLFIDAGRWDMSKNKLVDALPGSKHNIWRYYLCDVYIHFSQ